MWSSSSSKQYEKFRRLVRLSKGVDESNELARGFHPSYATTLSKDGFTSAVAILALPLPTFVSRVKHGIPEKDATAIYDRAVSVYETRAATSYEAVQGTGLAAIEGPISARERVEMVKGAGETLAEFGLEHLFGDMDRDVCDECNSFTSPAAYLVEILQFLRSRAADSGLKHEGQDRVYGTALDCLFARRPDLKKLELTCTNTKTVIPYLDLVNETMESFVVYLWDHAHPQLKRSKNGTIHPYHNPSPICREISTPPIQEINDDAYSILSEAMCPFNKLSYHQPLDEVRAFLKHLKTSRYELLDIYRRAYQAGTVVTKDKETSSSKETYAAGQARAVTAEYLSLTESEYICLTGEDYLANKYDAVADDGSTTHLELGLPSRLQAWWQYWGYKKGSDALQVKTGPELIKTEFLRRTGLKSSDLVELLSTEFVNPHVPRGNGLSILESNQFGFVSLGSLKPKGGSVEDPVLRYKALINFMAAQQIRSTSISKTGEFSRKQIEAWVKANHASFDKIIVLDNPHMSEGWHVGDARLTHLNESRLNPTELMRIQQFLRLRAKLGWPIDELDRAISALSRYLQAEKSQPDAPTTVPVITTKILDQLVCVSKLISMTGLELPKLLTFWSAMSTRGETSLYTQIFLTHSFLFIDPIFKPDEQGHYFKNPEKLTAHASFIMASLGLTKDGLDVLLNADLYSKGSMAGQDISIESLSFLYRHNLMSKILHITPSNLCQVIGVFGNIFESPSQTLDFFVQWKRMADARISFEQLNYVIKGVEDPLNPVGLSRPKILLAIKSLLDGIDVIHTTHPIIKEEEHDALTKESITEKLSLLYDSSQVTEIHQFLEGKTAEWVKEKLPSWLELTLKFIKEDDKKILYAPESTLAKKRFCFLRSFVPHLQQQLIERLVISIMSTELSIPSEMMRMLLTDVLRVEAGTGGGGEKVEVSALDAISSIRLLGERKDKIGEKKDKIGEKKDKIDVDGYLVPKSDELYTFVNSPQAGSTVLIDDLKLAFSNPGLPSADQIHLEGGRTYGLRVTNDTEHKFQWKTHASALHPLPDTVFLPRYAEERLTSIFIQLSKIALIVNSCKLSADEVKYIATYPHGAPILQSGSLTLEGWRQLLNYLGLRDGLPNKPSRELIHLFRWASNPEDVEADPRDRTLSERLASLMHVKESTIKSLLTHLSLNQRASFKGWANFTKLKKACDLSQKINVDVDTLFSWAEPFKRFEQVRKLAHEVQGTIKARYSAKDWEEVVKPLRLQLRSNQQDALVGYILNQPEIIKWKIFDVRSLFGFFLIDPQMGPCLDTSRIKQAISTVRLFIQRCLCGQEERFGVPIQTLDRRRWEWIKCYHTWETNRNIFMYPENWIEPSLRDDKSPVFQAFETDIIQSDMDPRSVQDAVKRYLSRLDEVANLHTLSMCSDTERNVVHIFARTRGAPYFYYYRSYSSREGVWKPWEKMQLDIPHYEDYDLNSANNGGTFLKPVVWMGRLIVFIPRFVKQVGGGRLPGLDRDNEPKAKSSQDCTNYEYWELKVGWTEYQNGKWTPKQTTSKAFRTESGPGGVGTLRECVFTTTFCNDDLYLTAQIEERRTAWFRLSKGQFDCVDAADLLSQEYAAAAPRLTPPKPGIHHEFGTIVDKDIVCVSTVDPSASNAHPSTSNNMHQCTCSNNAHPPCHCLDGHPTKIEYNRRNPTSAVFSASPDYQAPFYHEFSGHLLRHTNTYSTLDDLYCDLSSEISRFKDNSLGHAGTPSGVDTSMTHLSYHELKSPYGLYNWELGLHIPMFLMDKLRSCHQYEEALKIAHYVFDPMSHHSKEYGNNYYTKDDGGHSEIDYPKRSCVWKWAPFKEISAQNVLGRLLNSLKASSPERIGGHGQIDGSRDAPLHPHVLARSRPVAYMKWFVMSYINILLDYGDHYLRQNTSESLPQAFQCYALAAHLYGSPKGKLQKRGKRHPGTYESLVRYSPVVLNAEVTCQTTFPFTHSTASIRVNRTITAPTLLDGDVSLYFCVPENDKLKSLRAKIDDRLYRIQCCQNERGLSICKFDLAPPVDALALAQATIEGPNIHSILQGLNSPMPNYRFKYILKKAFEMVQELKSMGNAFLEAMARKDSERYNLIRAGYETSINAMILGMKKLSLEEANKALVSLQEARKGPASELEHLYRLLGESEKRCPSEGEEFKKLLAPIVRVNQHSGYRLTAFEASEIDKAGEATEFIEKRGAAETAAALLLGHPAVSTSAMQTSNCMGNQMRFDSLNLGEAASAYARAMAAQMDLLQSQSMGAARKSSLLCQYQDRIQKANSAGNEIKHVDSQIEEQKIRIKITTRDIELQQKRLELTARSEQFLKTKYHNQDLCIWREKQLRSLYHQTYTLAFDLAKKAESSFHFERGPANSFEFDHGLAITNFIQGTWDTNKDGLFSGEQLYLGLKRLEMAYNETRGYDYEITKHISLKLLCPQAFLELRELANCEFDIPEAIFDMDYPGHYKRRIKAVYLTFPPPPPPGKPGPPPPRPPASPSVRPQGGPPGRPQGPTPSVNCTMRLVKHSYRAKIPTDKEAYAKGSSGEDSNGFHTDVVPIDHYATSNGLMDGGVSRCAVDVDERYLPFEGAGAISRWKFELPPHYRAFDYRKVQDATVHIQYTSVYGGDTLKRIAGEYVDSYLSDTRPAKGGAFALFDLRLDFGQSEWSSFTGGNSMSMPNLDTTLPFFANKQYTKAVVVKEIQIFTNSNISDAKRWKLTVSTGGGNGGGKDIPFQGPTGKGLRCFSSGPIECSFGTWSISLADKSEKEVLRDVWVVAHYTVVRR